MKLKPSKLKAVSCRDLQVWWNSHWKLQKCFPVLQKHYQHQQYQFRLRQLHQVQWNGIQSVQQQHQPVRGSWGHNLRNKCEDDPYRQWGGLSTWRVSMAGKNPYYLKKLPQNNVTLHYSSVICSWEAHFIFFVWTTQAVLLNEEHRWFCGGTILNEYIILTAAHCMNETRYFYIKLGKDWYSGMDSIYTGALGWLAGFCWYISESHHWWCFPRRVWHLGGRGHWSCSWSGNYNDPQPVQTANFPQRHCAH